MSEWTTVYYDSRLLDHFRMTRPADWMEAERGSEEEIIVGHLALEPKIAGTVAVLLLARMKGLLEGRLLNGTPVMRRRGMGGGTEYELRGLTSKIEGRQEEK